MLIDSKSTVRDLLGTYGEAFDVLLRHGMCEDCKMDPPPVPLARFAAKHCGGDLSGLVGEIEAATRATRVAQSNHALIEVYKQFSAGMPDGRVDDLDGVTAAFCHVNLAFFNMCILDRPIADADDLQGRLERAAAYGDKAGFPWFFALCEDWLPNGWQDICTKAGFQQVLTLTGMAAQRLLSPRRTLPTMTFDKVEGAKGGYHVGAINCHAYGLPVEVGECLADDAFWQRDVQGYVGCAEGTPVSTSTVFPVDGTLYVAMVATLPDHGKRGFGEAVMRHSLVQSAAQWGPQKSALHATDAGRPLYAAMGYRDIARFAVLARQS